MRVVLAVAGLFLLAGCSSVSMQDFPDEDTIELNQSESIGAWDVLVTRMDVRVNPHTDCFTGCAPYYDAQYTAHVAVVRTAPAPDLRLRVDVTEGAAREGGAERYAARSSAAVVPFDLPLGELWKGTVCVGTPELDVRKTHKTIPLKSLTLESEQHHYTIRLNESQTTLSEPLRNTTGETQILLGEAFDVDGLRYVVEHRVHDFDHHLLITIHNPSPTGHTIPEPLLRTNDRLGNWTVDPTDYWSGRCGATPKITDVTVQGSSNFTVDRVLPRYLGDGTFSPPPTYLEVGQARRLLRVDFG